ncbi:hypothetical protein [Asticcacaulis excentricus]|uniref:Heat shock protein DnaJ-like protein n=1 Tax=Asticcacaulis excentricus (strain ATCC 15261 / DSM 4724 / KCTC 12464 / NCIMB 9791 / VKM B-1370 / CB 48) TaxID=573065 RepID=E8RN19_ASTEC|nr:hypothetical protein [Asticcacaulis excentricus]ADU12852.1 heat shock protein DnaJ-like protein [Asticcacaulis excentricus CB 48]
MSQIVRVLKIGAWIIAVAFAGVVLLALYAPYEAGQMLRALGIGISGQWLAVWAAFALGALIVLVALFGALSGSGFRGRRAAGKRRED